MQIRIFCPILTIVGALDPLKREEGRRRYFEVVNRKENPVSKTYSRCWGLGIVSAAMSSPRRPTTIGDGSSWQRHLLIGHKTVGEPKNKS